VQHALLAMLEKSRQGVISVERVIEKMANAPAELFQVVDRGYLREGYFADLVVVDPNRTTTVDKQGLLYKCGWSPFEGFTFSHRIESTYVNGRLVYDNGSIIESGNGARLVFNR
jgi:dihydroorotase